MIYINGKAYDHGNVELSIGGKIIGTCSALNYRDQLTPGQLRGSGPEILAYTRGVYEASGSMTMYTGEAVDLIKQISLMFPAKGYMEIEFAISATYTAVDNTPMSVSITGARITSNDRQSEQGGEAIMSTLEFVAKKIVDNGVQAVISGAL